MSLTRCLLFAVLALSAGLCLAPAALAQDDGETAEVEWDGATHPMIRLTPDKSELVRLDENAVTVLIGNPLHLSVLLDSPKLMVLVPRTPGSTTLTVLGARGKVIMQRHVIVASPKQKYVRVRRSCINADGADCAETRVYYCPDMCHEVAIQDGDPAVNNQATVSAGVQSGSASSGDNSTDDDEDRDDSNNDIPEEYDDGSEDDDAGDSDVGTEMKIQ